jgi:hypothetical protein
VTYAAARTRTAELALALLKDGEPKDDLYSVFLTISMILLTCNNDMVRGELQKAQDGPG